MKILKQLTISTTAVLLMGSQAFASISIPSEMTFVKHFSHKVVAQADVKDTNVAVATPMIGRTR